MADGGLADTTMIVVVGIAGEGDSEEDRQEPATSQEGSKKKDGTRRRTRRCTHVLKEQERG